MIGQPGFKHGFGVAIFRLTDRLDSLTGCQWGLFIPTWTSVEPFQGTSRNEEQSSLNF